MTLVALFYTVWVMGKAKDVSGFKFGKLTAIDRTGGKTVHGLLWNCQCDCGNNTVVVLSRLTTGHTKSCGCLVVEQSKLPKRVTHGHTRNALKAGASEYHIWATMKQRCTNPNNVSYPRYGGRGITIDPRWTGGDGYANFFADMGPRPSKHHSLDRKKSDGPYSVSNCRWATSREQNNNRSGTRQITYLGETLTSAEWARRTGIGACTIRGRIDKGWTPEKALCEPVGNTGRRS